MKREEILQIVKQIGIAKGYREDRPEDWYDRITIQEIELCRIAKRQYKRYYKSTDDIIKDIYPSYDFINNKFLKTTKKSKYNFVEDFGCLKKILFDFYKTRKRIPYVEEYSYLNIEILMKKYIGIINILELLSIPLFERVKYKNKHITKDYIINITKQIGVKKGYREDVPKDWYNGISAEEINKKSGIHSRYIYEYFDSVHDVIKNIFPSYNFIEYNFKCARSGFWDFNKLKCILIDFYNKNNRMITLQECREIGIEGAINMYGGIRRLSKNLNMPMTCGFITLYNHTVRSFYEVIFSNFCFLNNISASYEDKIIEDKNYRTDFKINNNYCEIWGYEGNSSAGEAYKNKRKTKEKIYLDNNLKLISIDEPILKIFRSRNKVEINSALIDIMKKHGIKIDNFNYNLEKLFYFNPINKNTYINDLREICLMIGVFKTITWLKTHGYRKQINYLINGCEMSMEELQKEIFKT